MYHKVLFTTAFAWICFGVSASQANNYSIRNIGTWSSKNRKQDRPKELWKYYMHGVLDFWANPVDFKKIIETNPQIKKFVDFKTRLDSPFKKSSQPSFKVRNIKGFTCRLPVPVEKLRGKRIRFFFWLKANKVGNGKGWHAPNIVIIPKGKDGKILYASNSYMHTDGTFPWHCYYIDRFIPEKADSLYAKFYSPNGVAHFTCLSWEFLSGNNRYSNNEKQDPHTGSLAPNVYYDQMAEHMTRGYGAKYKWRWLLGKDAGLSGQLYNITTKEGFREYYFQKAKHCPEHMNHAILHMGAMYRVGTKRKVLPIMEDGWFNNFAKVLIGDQDPQTGYWFDGKALSLGLTFHLCDMHFRYYGLKRSDRKDIIYSGHALVKYVPRADEIIRQTLKQQSSWIDSKGVKRLAAWNRAAYRYVENPDKYKQKCYLGSTWDAIYLLRLAERYVKDKTLKAKVYESVKQALYYILHKNALPSGVWLSRDTDTYVNNSSYYTQKIIQDAHWLERKISPQIPSPELSFKELAAGNIEFKGNFPAGVDSIRIYIAPKSISPDAVDESYLCGIIQRTGKEFYEMDPLIATNLIRTALAKRFGISLKLPPATNWRGKKYLPWKLRKIKNPLPFSVNNQKLVLNIKNIESKKVYFTGCTWYGEESVPKLIQYR